MPVFHRRFSIINQVIGLMLLIAILGIIGMTISNRMIISVQGNAHAINKSGSLRMQSYRLLSLIPLNDHTKEYLDILENDLSSLELTQVVKAEDLTEKFSELHTFWLKTLRPALSEANSASDARYEVISFVNMLDELVHDIDEKTERKIAYVAMTQMIFIGLVFLLLMVTIWHLRRKIYYPWMKLLSMAHAIGQKDFSQRYPNNNKQDELNTLGLTLNQMSDELAQSYHQLESRVAEKTADLRNKNRVLSYLYQSNQILHSTEPLDLRLQKVLGELKNITSLKNLSLKLYEDSNEKYFHEICCTSNDPLSEDPSFIPKDIVHHPKTLLWELSDNMHRYGVISAEIENNEDISEEQNNLVLMLVKQISGMLAMEHQIEQQQQLLSEMRGEINTAYSQLRELLTTFRLKLMEPGLLPSLESTINEFSQKMGFKILLNYHIPAKSISPHQSIHIIQIIREALSNILKHAHANWAQVTLQQDSGVVTITIEDNGEGIAPTPSKQNHYGLIIMRERALSLNGECEIIPRAQGGTKVQVTFSLPVT